MKKIAALILCAFILSGIFAGCSTDPDVTPVKGDTRKIIAEKYVDAIFNEDFAALSKFKLTVQMRLNLITRNQYKEVKEVFTDACGQLLEKVDILESENGKFRIVTVAGRFEKTYADINVVFDKNNTIAGLHYIYNRIYEDLGDREQMIAFGDTYPLSGALAIPDTEKPTAAVIIVHGSGPMDRNGAVGGNAVYLDIAEQLYNNGVASLRYDKRTYAYRNMPDEYYAELTVWEETIEDVIKAFEYLQNQAGIDPQRIYIAGHSLGGYLMPRIASVLPDAAGFVLLAPSASPLEDLIVIQTDYINNIDGNITKSEKEALEEIKAVRERIKTLEPDSGYSSSELFYTPESYWLDLRDYNPVEEMKSENRPILIIQGGRDYQVTTDEYEIWKNGLADNENAEFLLLPELNHMLAAGEGLSMSAEYQILSEVDQRIGDAISDFIDGHIIDIE